MIVRYVASNKLIFSFLFSVSGFWIVSFLIPLIILDISNEPFLVSISYTVNIIPYLVFTLFAGVLGDSFNKKKLIMLSEIMSAVTIVLIISTPFTKNNIYYLIALGGFISTFSAMHHPIFQSIIPFLYGEKELITVNSKINIIDTMVSVFIPLVIAVIISILTKKNILIASIVFYLLSFSFIFSIKFNSPKNSIARESILKSLLEGFRYVTHNKKLFNIIILFFFVNLGIRFIYPNLIWIFNSYYLASENKISLYFAIIGVGAVIGGRLAPIAIKKYSYESLIYIFTAFIGLASFCLLFTYNAISLSIIWAFSSLFQSAIIVVFFTYRQLLTDRKYLSRVISVTRFISYLSIPIATLGSGFILQANTAVINRGIEYIFLISFFIIIISMFVSYGLFRKITNKES